MTPEIAWIEITLRASECSRAATRGKRVLSGAGDPIVPRGVIERLHLDAGLLVKGNARRTGNGFEFVSLDAIEGMTVEEFRDSRHPFSELISIDPNEVFKLETESERLTKEKEILGFYIS